MIDEILDFAIEKSRSGYPVDLKNLNTTEFKKWLKSHIKE
jgi:hypothetical protein